MATLETKDSRSTLVEEAERARTNGTPHPLPPSPLTPASPFSASFDPNGPLPMTPESPLAPLIPARSPARPEAWSRTVSASLNTLASQFAAASQALATLPQTAVLDMDDESTTSSSAAVVSIQQAQARLEEELDSLREQITALGEHRRAEKEKERENPMIADEDIRDSIETRFLGIEKKLDDLAETIRLE
ncbi:hypothetical protein EIP86_011421 [Pleurotus ostreatoroseus]|nr:hypothetical protein EIP86_011421 [Pleurotus ostreatoroseus]